MLNLWAPFLITNTVSCSWWIARWVYWRWRRMPFLGIDSQSISAVTSQREVCGVFAVKGVGTCFHVGSFSSSIGSTGLSVLSMFYLVNIQGYCTRVTHTQPLYEFGYYLEYGVGWMCVCVGGYVLIHILSSVLCVCVSPHRLFLPRLSYDSESFEILSCDIKAKFHSYFAETMHIRKEQQEKGYISLRGGKCIFLSVCNGQMFPALQVQTQNVNLPH